MTQSCEASLIAALESSLVVAAKAYSSDHRLFFQVIALRDSPESAPQELQQLLKIIKSTAGLEIFENAKQGALGQQVPVDHFFLVRWLIARGQQVGARQAVIDLSGYLVSEAVELTAILAIDGFHVECDIALGEYELVDWARLPMTETKWQIISRGMFGGQFPTAAVVKRQTVPRQHVRPWESVGCAGLSIEPALDVLRCTTAVAGGGFRLLYHWLEPESRAPWAVQRSNFGVDSTAFPGRVSVSESPRLLQAVTQMSCLDEAARPRIRLALDRLNRSYLAGLRNVDKAIELGIALESVFVPAKLQEGVSFAVRTRAARFLGGSLEDRRQIVDLLKRVYDLRSRAVHAGRFDADDNRRWQDLTKVDAALLAGQRIVGQALVKIILESEPNWDDLDLGGVTSS